MKEPKHTRIEPKIRGAYKTYEPEIVDSIRKLREAEARQREIDNIESNKETRP